MSELWSASHEGARPATGPTLMTSSDPEHLPKSGSRDHPWGVGFNAGVPGGTHSVHNNPAGLTWLSGPPGFLLTLWPPCWAGEMGREADGPLSYHEGRM